MLGIVFGVGDIMVSKIFFVLREGRNKKIYYLRFVGW